jgi:hypothetical protein
MHVVLLGDSIFDNAAYIAGGPYVLHQVRERLGETMPAIIDQAGRKSTLSRRTE